MSLSFGSALIAASVTGLGTGPTAFTSTATQPSSLRRRIREMLADHLDDADDILAFAGMIEKGAVAFLHLHQILLGGVIADAGPCRALGAGLDLLVPRPRVRVRISPASTPSRSPLIPP